MNAQKSVPGRYAAMAIALVLLPAALQAKDKVAAAPQPKVLTDLLACRQIADPQARLACFDNQTAVLANAAASSDVIVADRKQVEETQRGLFGYSVPSSPLLNAGGGQAEVKRLDTTVKSARRGRDGNWIIAMTEGGVWEQTDGKPLALSPKPGQKVVLTKGAIGSYFASVDGQPAIKMRRIQ